MSSARRMKPGKCKANECRWSQGFIGQLTHIPSLFCQALAPCLFAHLLNSRKIMFTKSLDTEPPPNPPIPLLPFFFCRLAHTSRINWEQVSRSEYCLSSQQFPPGPPRAGEQNGMHVSVNAKKRELFYQLEVWLTFCSYKSMDDVQ